MKRVSKPKKKPAKKPSNERKFLPVFAGNPLRRDRQSK